MIRLTDIWTIEHPENYKVHFARANNWDHPLDVFVRDRDEWKGWQEYHPQNNAFNRPFIFSLMQFYHETNAWLFGGVYEVIEEFQDHYEVNLVEDGLGFVGRLKLQSTYKSMNARVNFENHYNDFNVLEILREPYSGEYFPGYENIDISFCELETIVNNQRDDWRIPLQSVSGIYVITDTNANLRYVGSAYGEEGVWSRWVEYANNGHGNNIECRRHLENQEEETIDYCRKYLKFGLLEHRASKTSEEVIVQRENYWKDLLQTRGPHGLNRN